MTRDSDFKSLVRARMSVTAENYTAARAALLKESAVAARASRDELRHYERTVRAFFDGHRLTSIPSRRRARTVVLLELLKRFEPDRRYSEREVSAILAEAYDDFAYLRRELVDYGYLSRDAHSFWMSSELPARTGNERQEIPTIEREIFSQSRRGGMR